MSSKAKHKTKNNEPKLSDVVAMASTADVGVAASPVVNVPIDEAALQPPLAIRLRIATSKAVVSVFARVRDVEAKAVERARAWITVADASISKSLLAGEQFLLLRLRVTLE